VLLAIIGALLGLPLGVALHRYIMVSIEQEGIMFGSYVANMSYVYAFVITMGFTALVNLFMYRHLVKIPMVESLKAIE
jgi:putative ABC transport system permease protein